jgi:hypothetical protein
VANGTASDSDYIRNFSIAVTPPPSQDTTVTDIAITIGGEGHEATNESNGAYVITLPVGTDLTALKLNLELPAGATIDPPITGLLDFSEGPITFTVTAEDGHTQTKITIFVDLDAPSSTVVEKPYFVPFAADCENFVMVNADKTVHVRLLIPLLMGSDVSALKSVRATIWNMSTTNLSYSVVGNGGAIPLTSSALDLNPPYLQIAFTVPSMTDLNKGVLGELHYNLWNDPATNYVQKFPDGAMNFSEIPKVDEPSVPVTPPAPEDEGDDYDDYDNYDDYDISDIAGAGCDTSGNGAGLFLFTLSFILLFFTWTIVGNGKTKKTPKTPKTPHRE